MKITTGTNDAHEVLSQELLLSNSLSINPHKCVSVLIIALSILAPCIDVIDVPLLLVMFLQQQEHFPLGT